MPKTNFYLWTIGCQQNVHDGTRLGFLLKNLGLKETGDSNADYIFIIACAVRQTAVDRIFGKIKDWKDKKIIVTGCVLSSDKKRLAERGVFFWNIEKPEDLPKILDIKNSQDIKKLFEEGSLFSSSIPIMYGCDNFCSYCATPYTRGRERSRDFEKIISEAKELIKSGKKEILLLGQNVNSYKIDKKLKIKMENDNPELKDKKDFSILLQKLDALKGDFQVSFTSNHPKDMSDDIIEAVATLKKVKREIHLPLQSGSNKILKAMNRPYTKEQYLKIIEKIRQSNPEIQITTDVIIGFPGETKDDFNQTAKIFKKIGYKMAYINKYSPRAGTAAFKLGDPIPWREKQRRWHELDKILSKTRC